MSTPPAKSNILNNETIGNISKISFSQKLPSKNNFQNNNNKNNYRKVENIIYEEITINSVEIHLGKIRLNQDKFINILKELFNKVIFINSDILSFKIKKDFIIFLFKIIFQCYLPFESAINYFITQLSKIQSNDIKDFIYIMSAMISSVNTQENYQVLINIILPSIQTLCNSISSKTLNNNNFDKDALISLKKVLKLLKDTTNFEKSNSKCFPNNSINPIHLFSIVGNILDYYISIAQNINLKNLTQEQIYLVQIKPISYIVQIYYNLFNYYIQIPLFLNTNYSYMKNLFYKLTKIIFSIDIINLFGYANKFKELMKLIKIIYCDYIMMDFVLINDLNNNYNEINNYICDINYIPDIIKLFTYIINEDYIENPNDDKNDLKEEKIYEKINLFPKVQSAENIRECFKDFNNIIYDWCKLYIQNQSLLINKANNNKNENGIFQNNNSNNNIQILINIFSKDNINSLLYEILLPLLLGLILNNYSITELNDSLSKSIFILAYAFPKEYMNIFNNIMNSNIIKQIYNEEEINGIKYNFEQLNNIQKLGGDNQGNNNTNEIVDSYFELFREQLKEFVKKIQNIIVSRKKDINININTVEVNDENLLLD